MAESILLKNHNRGIKESLKDYINYTDLDFDLHGRRGVSVVYGDALIVNYIIWLRSMPGDFIRNPERGGFFRNQLNRYTFSPESEQQIANDLKAESESLFPALQILDVNVKCVYAERKWQVKVTVYDKIAGLVGSTSESFSTVS